MEERHDPSNRGGGAIGHGGARDFSSSGERERTAYARRYLDPDTGFVSSSEEPPVPKKHMPL